MSRSVDSLTGSTNTAEDLHSMGTVSNSDTKSYDTVFSRNVTLACPSPYHTTPSHSRPSTPISCQGASTDMDADLRGIGHMTDSANSGHLEPTISSNVERQKQFQSNIAINFHGIDSSPNVSAAGAIFQPDKVDTIMNYQDNPATSSYKSYFMNYSPNTSSVDRLLTDSSSADTFSLYNSLSGSDASLGEEDLDLEKSANDALSQWFGVSLHRLVRPTRVIYAFEQVKQQCAGILQDEGHQLPDSQGGRDDNEIEDVQMDPYDAGEGSGSNHVGGIPSTTANNSPTSDKRQFHDSGLQSGSSPESYVKIKSNHRYTSIPSSGRWIPI
ncbi:hypothetical protein F5Y13DRAFT_195298 [Hypoxylon sp. FL1857]|nr:hypothetical protein F5Y13DRAFT_195298 [Hypoxylon sp. FL1857]